MKNNRAIRHQQRIAERRESRRAARTANRAAVNTKNLDRVAIRVQVMEMPGAWRLAVLRHSHRDPRMLGREDEAIDHVRKLAQPYTCGGCGTTPDLLAVGVLDTPSLDRIGIRCPVCRSTALGLYSDLAVLGTSETLTDEELCGLVQGIAQRGVADAEVMAKDAAWFERNPGRRLRLRPPMNDMERGGGAPPAPDMRLLVMVQRDENPWRTPASMWVPAGMLGLDVQDTPAWVDGTIMDALIEAHFAFAAEAPGPIDPGAIFHRAVAIHRAHEQATEAARSAAQRSEGGAA